MTHPVTLSDEFLALYERTSREFGEHHSEDAREQLRQKVLGRKGELAKLFERISSLTGTDRAEAGKTANHIRESLQALFVADEKSADVTAEQLFRSYAWSHDSSQPVGHPHPLREFLEKVTDIFRSLGYDVLDSPELEDEQHNFDLLNIPKDHPARDAWDTFFVSRGKGQTNVLRTHTSPMQIRAMQKRKPPVKIIVPGRVFRHEATDATHGSTFYQCEGFCVAKQIRLTDLQGTLAAILHALFGESIRLRFRPHHYSFVEPGMDVDMQFCTPGKDPRWLEMLGSGMIHPVVLRNMGINPAQYSGFAFGLGIDRLAMLWYSLKDVREYYSPRPEFISLL